jgi:DNA-binding transcriptional ArsR family regulator
MTEDTDAGERPGEQSRLLRTDAMRALAHPLRWALINLLDAEGQATAARCGHILDQPQANCSYHLRVLAKYGLVEEAPSSSRRDRPWRLRTVEQTWSSVQPDPDTRLAARELSRVFVEHEARKLLDWVQTRESHPEAWQRAASILGAHLWLTAEELDRIASDIEAVMKPYRHRSEDPTSRPADARPVRVFAASYPLPSSPREA